MSRFVSNAIRKALDEELKNEQELDAAYEAANQDTERLKTLQDWNNIDDISDLIDDEDWGWLRKAEAERKLKHG